METGQVSFLPLHSNEVLWPNIGLYGNSEYNADEKLDESESNGLEFPEFDGNHTGQLNKLYWGKGG